MDFANRYRSSSSSLPEVDGTKESLCRPLDCALLLTSWFSLGRPARHGMFKCLHAEIMSWQAFGWNYWDCLKHGLSLICLYWWATALQVEWQEKGDMTWLDVLLNNLGTTIMSSIWDPIEAHGIWISSCLWLYLPWALLPSELIHTSLALWALWQLCEARVFSDQLPYYAVTGCLCCFYTSRQSVEVCGHCRWLQARL